MKIRNLINTALCLTALSACSSIESLKGNQDNFISSGSIVISKSVPAKNITQNLASISNDKQDFDGMNNLLGYFPPTNEFTPAFNEMWLEIESSTNTARLMQGDNVFDEFKFEGISNKPGYYFVTSKELEPTWNAPESYFISRGLSVPQNTKRHGAYGDMAVFGAGGLVIHAAPIWSHEVGGIKLTERKLAKIFSNLPLGSQILVK